MTLKRERSPYSNSRACPRCKGCRRITTVWDGVPEGEGVYKTVAACEAYAYEIALDTVPCPNCCVGEYAATVARK